MAKHTFPPRFSLEFTRSGTSLTHDEALAEARELVTRYNARVQSVVLPVHFAVLDHAYRERARDERAVAVDISLNDLARYCLNRSRIVVLMACSVPDRVESGSAITHLLVCDLDK